MWTSTMSSRRLVKDTRRLAQNLWDASAIQRSLAPATSPWLARASPNSEEGSAPLSYLAAAALIRQPPHLPVISTPPNSSSPSDYERMGSFTSSPKIMNVDSADLDVELEALPESRTALLERCRRELADLPPMIQRAFVQRPHSSPNHDSALTIRVLQWNVLAQVLAEKADRFVKCPAEALNWEKRRWRILEEILAYSPDVLCVQEVDHYNFLKATLGRVGYSGVFYPKPDSPCYHLKGNNGPDGSAIFYDTSKFQLVRCERRVLEVFRCQSNQVVIVCVLKRKLDDAEFCVVTTHLKARNGALLSSLRNEQGKDLVEFVNTQREGRPVIICGDFNAEPTEPVYRTMLSQTSMPLESAYFQVESKEPNYTTWKIREEGEVCHTIDYIFASRNSFTTERVLAMPTSEELGEARAPSLTYPSDHFSLVADLKMPVAEKSFL